MGTFFTLGFLFVAELMKLVLNIEDHLYAMRNVDKPLFDIRQSVRTEIARQKTVEEAKQLAGQVAALLGQGAQVAGAGIKGAAEAVQHEVKKTQTGQLTITPPKPISKPPSQPTAAKPPSSPIKETQTLPALPEAADLYKEAVRFAKKGEYEAAIKTAERVLMLDPKYTRAADLRDACEIRMNQQR